MSEQDQRFEFGKNWLDYIHKNFNEENVEISKTHMLGVLGRDGLKGISLLDIGCGSGLHSYAAWKAGTSILHSFDYDTGSVEATRFVHAQAGNPANWTVEQGFVLDQD